MNPRRRASALRQHAHGKTNTAPARQAFLARFEREVDPAGVLPETERRRRAELAKRAYFIELRARRAA